MGGIEYGYVGVGLVWSDSVWGIWESLYYVIVLEIHILWKL